MKRHALIASLLLSLSPTLSLASILECKVTENNLGNVKQPVVHRAAFNEKGFSRLALGTILDYSVTVLAAAHGAESVLAIDAQNASGSSVSTEGKTSAQLKLRADGTAFELQCSIEN